jgi:hypothetical protein
MPHTTFEYGFEWRVLELAQTVCQSGARSVRTCLIPLDRSGARVSLVVDLRPHEWLPAKERLRQEGQPYLFFDPFDAPEYTWLEWFQVDRAAMERLLGRPFAEADFAPLVGRRRAPRLDPPGTFPESWGVMF